MKILGSLKKRYVLAGGSALMVAFLMGFSVFALKVDRSEVTLYEKSDGVVVYDSSEFENNGVITPDISFSEVGDSVTYRIRLNGDSDYKIVSVSDDNENESIGLSYSYDKTEDESDKNVYITLAYENEPTNNLDLAGFEVTVNYEEIEKAGEMNETEEMDVPNTGDKTNDSAGKKNANAPDTGGQILMNNTGIEGFGDTKIILSVVLICTVMGIILLVLRRRQRKEHFGLGESSRFRRTLCNLVGLAIAGMIITGGAISITHATGSSSIKLSFDLSKVRMDVKPTAIRTVEFVNNAPDVVDSAFDNTRTCNLYFDETTCEIELPDFTVVSGYEVMGWDTDKNKSVEEVLYQPGEKVSFSADTRLYTITRGKLEASFINRHSEYFDITKESDFCYIYNSKKSCSVATPAANIRAGVDDAEFLGWSKSDGSVMPEVSVGGSVEILEDNTEFYSVVSFVTKYSYEVYFVNQDKTGISQISQASATCTLPEGETDCDIVLPNITVNQGHEALGWNKSSNSTNATYVEGQTVTVSGSTTFYTVSRKALTATFENLQGDYFSVSASSAQCYVYNGSREGCDVSLPIVDKLTDDERTTFLGWNTNPETRVGMETGSDYISIDEDSAYYLIAKVPTDTIYSIKFSNDTWDKNLEPLSYFLSTEDCSRSSDLQCIEVIKSCVVYTWEDSCTIIAPEFNTVSGWDAYGYDIQHPIIFYSPSDRTSSFVGIGDDIIVTVSNNGQKYYNLIKSQNYVTATFVNQHTNYLTSSSSSESCYVYNNNGSCSITTPSLTPKTFNSGVTETAWSKNSTKYEGKVIAGEETDISSNTIFYSGALGIAYTITFDKNINFEDSSWLGNNIIADSLSFYQTQCVVTSDGCYLSNIPRIYSTGNTPAGFSISQYEWKRNVPRLLNYNFIADTTFYSRIFNWGDVPASSFITTKKIYQPATNDNEYFQIDFEENLNEDFAESYREYIDKVFTDAPQLYVLHGKIRFLTNETFDIHHADHPGATGLTSLLGIFAPIDIKPKVDNVQDGYTNMAVVHELGHALDTAWDDLYGEELSSKINFQNLYNKYIENYVTEWDESGFPSAVTEDAPFGIYPYKNKYEFFANAFSVWYGKRSKIKTTNYGYTFYGGDVPDEKISDLLTLLDSYFCTEEYESAAVCNIDN